MSVARPSAVLIGDNTAVDALAAAFAAMHPHQPYDLKAIVVTGRPVGYDPSTGRDDYDVEASARVLQRDTRRMRGFVNRAGRPDIPVFEGLIHPHSTIPPATHADTSKLDIHNDAANLAVDGSFREALELIAQLPPPIHIIAGGPLTEAAVLLDHPEIHPKLGHLVFQGPLVQDRNLTDKPMGGGRRQFNVAADPEAAHKVFTLYPGRIIMVPTDVTRDPRLVFKDADALADLGIHDELIDLYRRAAEVSYKRAGRSGKISIHDAELPIALGAIVANENAGLPPDERNHGPYTIDPVNIDAVPHTSSERDRWGEVSISPTPMPKAGHPRWSLVRNVGSPEIHARALQHILSSPLPQAQVTTTTVNDAIQHLYRRWGKPRPELVPEFRRLRGADRTGLSEPQEQALWKASTTLGDELARTLEPFSAEVFPQLSQYMGDPRNGMFMPYDVSLTTTDPDGTVTGGVHLNVTIASTQQPDGTLSFFIAGTVGATHDPHRRPPIWNFATGQAIPSSTKPIPRLK